MGLYRKRPVVVAAVQLRWDNWSEMCDHAKVGRLDGGHPQGVRVDAEGQVSEANSDGRIALAIPTLEGLMIGVQGDWIIKGVKGELYPCKPDIFAATYEPVTEETAVSPYVPGGPMPMSERVLVLVTYGSYRDYSVAGLYEVPSYEWVMEQAALYASQHVEPKRGAFGRWLLDHPQVRQVEVRELWSDDPDDPLRVDKALNMLGE